MSTGKLEDGAGVLVQPWLCSANVAEDSKGTVTQHPQSLSDEVCDSAVFSAKCFVFDPILYITRNFVLAGRQLFPPTFHRFLVSGDFTVLLL